jgi:hypothetical protein
VRLREGTGEKVGKGKKNGGVGITYQSTDKIYKNYYREVEKMHYILLGVRKRVFEQSTIFWLYK